jgi:hypothetical protein
MRSGYQSNPLIYASVNGVTWIVTWLVIAWIFEGVGAVPGLIGGVVVFAASYFMRKQFGPNRRL